MAQLIPAAELTSLKSYVATAFDQTCAIQRKNPTRTTEGYQVDGYATIPGAGNIGCNLTEPTPVMMQNYDYLIGPLEAWLVRLPAGQDVKRDDQLVISGTGVTLHVHVVLDMRSYAVNTRVLAAAVR